MFQIWCQWQWPLTITCSESVMSLTHLWCWCCPKPIWLLCSTSTKLLLCLNDVNERPLTVDFLFTQQWLMEWIAVQCGLTELANSMEYPIHCHHNRFARYPYSELIAPCGTWTCANNGLSCIICRPVHTFLHDRCCWCWVVSNALRKTLHLSSNNDIDHLSSHLVILGWFKPHTLRVTCNVYDVV